jgi:hypothetical protein
MGWLFLIFQTTITSMLSGGHCLLAYCFPPRCHHLPSVQTIWQLQTQALLCTSGDLAGLVRIVQHRILDSK